jgi:hypothetical protein
MNIRTGIPDEFKKFILTLYFSPCMPHNVTILDRTAATALHCIKWCQRPLPPHATRLGLVPPTTGVHPTPALMQPLLRAPEPAAASPEGDFFVFLI